MQFVRTHSHSRRIVSSPHVNAEISPSLRTNNVIWKMKFVIKVIFREQYKRLFWFCVNAVFSSFLLNSIHYGIVDNFSIFAIKIRDWKTRSACDLSHWLHSIQSTNESISFTLTLFLFFRIRRANCLLSHCILTNSGCSALISQLLLVIKIFERLLQI